MKIVIDPFDSKSIENAVKQMEQYAKDFRTKETEFIRRLKEIGVSVAEAGFALADYDGVNDVVISSEQTGGRAAVIAFGETVGFIEFGTGVKYPEWSTGSTEYTPPAHGTYGKGHGKNPHGWWFKPHDGGTADVRVGARHTYGNPPAEAMLEARNVMVEQVIAIAREVWK